MFKKFFFVFIILSNTIVFSMERIQRNSEELAIIKNEIFEETKKYKNDFNKIKEKKENIIVKWREMIALSIPIAKKIVSKHGYPDTYVGTQKFTLEYISAQANNPRLSKINEDLYNFLYLETFGVTGETKTIPVETARTIIKQAAINVDTEKSQEELKNIKKIDDPLKKIIASAVFTYQMAHEAAQQFGFSKDDIGFIDVQRALTPYYNDQVIMADAYGTINKIYQSVGINITDINKCY